MKKTPQSNNNDRIASRTRSQSPKPDTTQPKSSLERSFIRASRNPLSIGKIIITKNIPMATFLKNVPMAI